MCGFVTKENQFYKNNRINIQIIVSLRCDIIVIQTNKVT